MAKRYRKIVFRFFKEYFRFPKIAAVSVSILMLSILLNNLSANWKFEIILGLFYVLIGGIFVIYFRRRKNDELEQVKYGKKWMLKYQIFSYNEFGNILNCIPLTLNFPFVREYIPIDSVLTDFLFSIVLISLAVLSYVILFIIPKKAEELLTETYPEYKMV